MILDRQLKILNVKIDNITSSSLNDEILRSVRSDRKDIYSNVNIHAMNIAHDNQWFKNFLNKAYVNFCDGDGVRVGAKILGRNIKEKITYNRWIWDLADFSENNNLSWFLLGSREGVVEECKNILIKKYPLLNICGYHHGFLNDIETNRLVVSEIEKKKPNILIIGMGMPLQEKWLLENIDNINFNVALTGGAVFDYISEKTKMTPNFYYKYKLEWFYRFVQEPRRLFKRYFFGNPIFIWRVFLERIGIINFK